MSITMRRLVTVAAAAAMLGCGAAQDSTRGGTAGRLELKIGDAPLQVAAGGQLVVQIVVVGDGSEGAVVTSPQLPAFATLTGVQLTLSPSREYSGTYPITLVATTATSTATAALQVEVLRFNTAPKVGTFMDIADDTHSKYADFTCPSAYCLVQGTPTFTFFVSDDEGDTVTAALEVVPSDQPFDGRAIQTTTVPTQAGHYSNLTFTVPGLIAGTVYKFRVKATDEPGAQSIASIPAWTFQQGPCSPGGPCMCIPSGVSIPRCSYDGECCSGRCIPGSAATLGACQ